MASFLSFLPSSNPSLALSKERSNVTKFLPEGLVLDNGDDLLLDEAEVEEGPGVMGKLEDISVRRPISDSIFPSHKYQENVFRYHLLRSFHNN